jgi:hypothetical protein
VAGYRIRREGLNDGSLVVVRAGLLERAKLIAAATKAFGRFGGYGVSVFAAPDAGSIDDLARTRFKRNRWLTITTVGDIRRAGLEILPTFRRPHCTVMLPDLNADVDRLLRCQTVVAVNPHATTLEEEP